MGFRRFIAALGAVAVVSALAVVGIPQPEPAAAVTASDFNPGYIISDEKFFDKNAMTEAQIQSFLQKQIGTCGNTNCLNVKTLTTTTRYADAMCGKYEGAADEPASRIIYKVAQACGINPQVLIVTLHKEQSLVTGSIARAPSDSRLDRAMGYACPDNTAIPGYCDPAFGGLYNQLYKAAWQFKRYANPPGTSKFFTWFAPGTRPNVLYNPNSACGSSAVTIQNQATANLYYYTPYQPNEATLAAKFNGGPLDRCGAYGNINFFIFFNQWFGSTTGSLAPMGAFDSATTSVNERGAALTVSGWAFDRLDQPRSIEVHAYVDGPDGSSRGYPLTADLPRPDVGAVYPVAGPNHGFTSTVPVQGPGTYDVCLFAIVSLGGQPMGCRTVHVPVSSPIGSFDSAVHVQNGSTNAINISGWSADPAVGQSPVQVHVYVDKPNGSTSGIALASSDSRPDIARYFAWAGPTHGFSSSIPVTSPGTYRACAYAIGIASLGGNTALGCRNVVVGPSTPVGSFDGVSLEASGSESSIRVHGWSFDATLPRDTTAVDLYVDRPDGSVTGNRIAADKVRPDVGRVFPAAGANHGFDASVGVREPGMHKACAFAIGTSNFGASSTLLGCRSLSVISGVPRGSFDSVTITPSAEGSVLTSRGWAADPGAPQLSIPVHIYVDRPSGTTSGSAVTADGDRQDIRRVFPEFGAAHGFTSAVTVKEPGRYTVCAYAIGSAPFSAGNSSLGCKTVTIP